MNNPSHSKESRLRTFPLRQLSLDEAMECQFRLMDCVFHHFSGLEIIQDGDYGHGIGPDHDRPRYTVKVEETLARFFECPDVALIRGGGTGAIRACLMAGLRAGQRVLLHEAPSYPTSAATMELLSLHPIFANMNEPDTLTRVARDMRPEGAFVQHTRNMIDDSYELGEVLHLIREATPRTLIVTDDSYAAMRVLKIGAQLGADLSTFSFFKLLGPPGLGCVVAGSKQGQAVMADIRRLHHSGGITVHGPEAMAVLRALTLAPVAMAVQARVVDEVANRLGAGEVTGITTAFVANSNSRCVIVELHEPIAQRLLEVTQQLGGQRISVGSECWVEISAVFHEPFPYFSPTAFPWLAENRDRFIRINPYRTGADTIIRVLSEAMTLTTAS